MSASFTLADPSKSALTMLNNLISRAVNRIFNVADSSVIKDIRRFLGLCDIESLYRQRRAKFEKKTSTLMHPLLQTYDDE